MARIKSFFLLEAILIVDRIAFLRRIGNISAVKRRQRLVKSDQFGNLEVSLEALTSQLFLEIQ